MACQVLRDSFHRRLGWVEWYRLTVAGVTAGYGALVVAGPWSGSRALFEVYVVPQYRSLLIPLTEILIRESRSDQMLVQTNDPILVVLMHQFCAETVADKLIFRNGDKSHLPNPGVEFRRKRDGEDAGLFTHVREPVGDWVLEREHEIVATGGYLTHYNPAYVDLYLEVREDMRRRGFGSYMVQELKRVAEEEGHVACGRCDPDNMGSIKALARAGMIPCAHRVVGTLKRT